MHTSVSVAKTQLTELVRRAEAGDDIVLTRHGQAVARLVPIRPATGGSARRVLFERVRASGAKHAGSGADASSSQDFLYGEDGLPH